MASILPLGQAKPLDWFSVLFGLCFFGSVDVNLKMLVELIPLYETGDPVTDRCVTGRGRSWTQMDDSQTRGVN